MTVKPQSDAQRACNSVWIRSQLTELRRIVGVRDVSKSELLFTLDYILAGKANGEAAEVDAATATELRRYRSTRR